MDNPEVIQLQAAIEKEEESYFNELRTTQKFDKLKAIRLKIYKLKQELWMLENRPPEQFPFI